MWDLLLVTLIIFAALAYLARHFKAVLKTDRNKSACGGCDSFCGEGPQDSGGFAV